MLSNKLLELLRANSQNPIVSRCLQTLESSEIRFSLGAVIPLTTVLDIYSVRSEINANINNGAIQGFDDLLASLECAPNDSLVRIGSLELLTKWFIFFTDEQQLVLYGILESSKRKEFWFDRYAN